MQKITEWVDAQYRQERSTAISDEEMLLQVRRYLPELLSTVEPHTEYAVKL